MVLTTQESVHDWEENKNLFLEIKIKWNHWMTVQNDSQLVTNQIMKYIDMCCINNSISCLVKKTT